MTEQEMLKEALEWQEHIRKLITATDDELYHKRSKVFDWLIQQAERVQELKLEVNDWRAEVLKWQKFYKESEASHSETKELLKSIVNQNKRYREALESILNNDQMYITNEEIILKALEESE